MFRPKASTPFLTLLFSHPCLILQQILSALILSRSNNEPPPATSTDPWLSPPSPCDRTAVGSPATGLSLLLLPSHLLSVFSTWRIERALKGFTSHFEESQVSTPDDAKKRPPDYLSDLFLPLSPCSLLSHHPGLPATP